MRRTGVLGAEQGEPVKSIDHGEHGLQQPRTFTEKPPVDFSVQFCGCFSCRVFRGRCGYGERSTPLTIGAVVGNGDPPTGSSVSSTCVTPARVSGSSSPSTSACPSGSELNTLT